MEVQKSTPKKKSSKASTTTTRLPGQGDKRNANHEIVLQGIPFHGYGGSITFLLLGAAAHARA